jgi:hypothetical protein
MSLASSRTQLQLPETLRKQLLEFRRRVWSTKLAEAACAAVFGVLVAFLLMFGLDRVWDTPGWPRVLLFVTAAVACSFIPLALHRWVWRNRSLEQLARLLTRKHPHVGDQLLGIIELVHSDSEQARSLRLCEAAIQQVAQDAQRRNFRDAVPNPRHRVWGGLVLIPIIASMLVFAFFPAAAANGWARFAAPWKNTPRFTFAAVQSLPSRLVVAHGEPFSLAVPLEAHTLWRPAQGSAQFGSHSPVTTRLRDGGYRFELPPQLTAAWLRVRIGDSDQRIRIEPTLRPELTGVVANVTLPDYLARPGATKKDARGGSVSLVKGSRASFTALASRELATGAVDGRATTTRGAALSSPETLIENARKLEFRWQDTFGLAGKEPFILSITARDDEPPSLSCEDLPRQRVVLDTETLTFKVNAQDDFGIKRIGIEWQGVEHAENPSPATGEKILAAGGNDKESMEIAGAFCAKNLGIAPQAINVRVFAEDFFPGRGRSYSPTFSFFVLTAEQHAIWLTEQLSKWHRQSLEVRDREMQLFETNKQLRALNTDELDRPETRRKIENQASAERANGRRLSNLVASGEDLVRQAARNPEFGVGHLEKWAEMLQILKDISGHRMPSVADLLNQAAQAPSGAIGNEPARKNAPMAGQNRSSTPARPSEPSKDAAKNLPSAPQVVDRESSQQPAEKNADDKPSTSKPKPGRLLLAQTTLNGKSKPDKPDKDENSAEEKVDEAVTAQQDLLAEFDKIAEELNKVLARLEGSTLVKRLKAASREQYTISGRLGDQVGASFGLAANLVAAAPSKVFGDLADQEAKGSQKVSVIMDDMQSYYERRQFLKFRTVLDDMRKQDVVGGLRQLGDDLKKESGVSIAQCEFWSDTLDRWAEDLVDPTSSGKCPGSKSRASLPPSVVLEVLQILEGEVNLREETRVAEQAKAAVASEEHHAAGRKLSSTQDVLRERVDRVTQRIRELPDGEKEFGKEIRLLMAVSDVMTDATKILAVPDTGRPAIAAETEAIELLLQSKRINPKGGGGGGSTPGGGGSGKTTDSALALLGGGMNDKEVREDHGIAQATGESGPVLPEEFRAGLDEYFNRLERRPPPTSAGR